MKVTVADIANELRIEASDTMDDFTAGIAKDINDQILALNQKFFIGLSNAGIDKAQPPNLGEYTVPWTKLTQRYRDWKFKHKLSLNFYMKHGDLKTELARLKPSQLLGEATTTQRGGPSGDPNVVLRTFTYGRGVRRVAVNRATGRFAKFSDIFVPGTYYIEVIPFPKVSGVADDRHSLESIVFGTVDPVLFYKFTTAVRPKGHIPLMRRPLLGPFLNWYINIFLKRKIEGLLT